MNHLRWRWRWRRRRMRQFRGGKTRGRFPTAQRNNQPNTAYQKPPPRQTASQQQQPGRAPGAGGVAQTESRAALVMISKGNRFRSAADMNGNTVTSEFLNLTPSISPRWSLSLHFGVSPSPRYQPRYRVHRREFNSAYCSGSDSVTLWSSAAGRRRRRRTDSDSDFAVPSWIMATANAKCVGEEEGNSAASCAFFDFAQHYKRRSSHSFGTETERVFASVTRG